MGRGKSSKPLVAFSGGEWSPRLHARVDLDKATVACRTLENMVVETNGVARRRPGTQYVRAVGLITSTGTATLETRNRSGSGSLCGFPEYIPSSPPRYYLRKSNSGSARSVYYELSNCLVPTGVENNCTYDGICIYDPNTCTVSTSGGVHCDGSLISVGCFEPVNSCDATVTYSRLQASRTSTNECCLVDGFWRIEASDSLKATLSSEDTEAAAIARVSPVPSWSAWTAGSSKTAWIEMRGAGVQMFSYAEGEFRVSVVGLSPSRQYRVEVLLKRRLHDTSDPFVDFQTLRTTETADGSGEIVITDEIPNSIGYETQAASVQVFPLIPET